MSHNSSSDSTSPPSTAATSPLHDVPEAGVQSRGSIQPCSDYLEMQSEASLKGRNPRADVFVPKPKSDDNYKPESMISDLGDNGSCEGCYFRLEVEKQNGDLIIENNDLKTKLADHKAELDRTTDAYAQQIHMSMGPLEEKIKDLERELANADERRKQQEIRHASELSTVQSQRDALKKIVSNLESKLTETKDSHEKTLSALQKRLDDSEDFSNKTLVAAKKANITHSDNIRQLKEENEKLRQKADSSEKEVETKDQEVEKFNGLFEEQKDNLNAEKKRRKQAEKDKNASALELAKTKITLSNTESKLKKVQEKKKSADDHKKKMKKSLEEMEDKMKLKSKEDADRISNLKAEVSAHVRQKRRMQWCYPAFFLLGFMSAILILIILIYLGVRS